MNNMLNHNKRKRKLVNWITVWGFIFACIAYNFYIDGRQTRMERKLFRNQFQTESQRADSLRRTIVELEQRLQEVKSVHHISTNQPDGAPKIGVAIPL